MDAVYTNGVASTRVDKTPLGFEHEIGRNDPGCAARPWALRYYALGVFKVAIRSATAKSQREGQAKKIPEACYLGN